MAGKTPRRGRRVPLPLVGLKVTEICFGRGGPVRVVFGDRDDTDLRIEEAITLRRGRSERVLTGSRPGTTFDIGELGPVLEVFGLLVQEAIASADGTLQLHFAGDLVLCVIPATGYEAWHFRSPGLRLHRTYGHLI